MENTEYRLFRHPIETRGGMVCVWVTNGVHDNVGNLVYTTIVHVVGEIIQMEEPVEEIAAGAELGVTDIGITHRGKFTSFEAVKGTASSLTEVGVTVKYPSLRFDGDEFVVPACVEVELAMGDEIRK